MKTVENSYCRWFAPHFHLVQLIAYLSADIYLCNEANTGSSLSCPALLRYVNIGVIASIIITSVWLVRLHLQRKPPAKTD